MKKLNWIIWLLAIIIIAMIALLAHNYLNNYYDNLWVMSVFYAVTLFCLVILYVNGNKIYLREQEMEDKITLEAKKLSNEFEITKLYNISAQKKDEVRKIEAVRKTEAEARKTEAEARKIEAEAMLIETEAKLKAEKLESENSRLKDKVLRLEKEIKALKNQ